MENDLFFKIVCLVTIWFCWCSRKTD